MANAPASSRSVQNPPQRNAIAATAAALADAMSYGVSPMSTAFAADAWAKLTHRVGMCNVTVGPGAVKLPSGLLESYNASVPILAIVSDVGSEWAHLQERGATTKDVRFS